MLPFPTALSILKLGSPQHLEDQHHRFAHCPRRLNSKISSFLRSDYLQTRHQITRPRQARPQLDTFDPYVPREAIVGFTPSISHCPASPPQFKVSAARMSAVIEDQITSPWSVHSKTHHLHPYSSRRARSDTRFLAEPSPLLPSDFDPGAQRYRLFVPISSTSLILPTKPALCTRRR